MVDSNLVSGPGKMLVGHLLPPRPPGDELRAILDPLGCTLRSEDLCMLDGAFAGTVGCGGNDRALFGL
jgi:hypothetical protein